ncbi:Utp14 protein-domain-containing protein [Panaeolus papilionaceus]|nr:Utp14 protein-domain-containing protein [Panaeolus papilionaceus]
MKASKPSRGAQHKKAPFKSQKSRAQANATGYEKRQARKAKAGGGSTADLYEYIPEKTRRSKVALDLDRDEAMDFGSFDGMGDEEREELRARLIGEAEDDEEIASEDDEEIDSDAAFEESDEERFAGFFSSKKKGKTSKSKSKPGVRFAEVDLNEDDDEEAPAKLAATNDDDSESEEEEEGDDDEFIDLLDVLDGKGDIDMGSDDEKEKTTLRASSPKQSTRDSDEDSAPAHSDDEKSRDEDEGDSEIEDDEGEEGDEDEDDEMLLTPSDDELMPDALDQLQNFVSGLDVTSKKRKAADDPSSTTKDGEQRSTKRRLVKEKTEAGHEDEFRAHSAAKLNLDDLLAPLTSQSSTLQSLKKTTKVLSSVNSTKAKKLSAPLPQRAQERLDREAAYEQTKEEAEHLSFPLQAKPAGRVSNLELNAKFKPTTALESSVDALLKAANLREEDLQKTEDTILKTNQLTVEEVAERRVELRKMRELTFRAEIKARRMNKIKSKTYRKLRRKEKERLGEKIDEQVDSDDEEVRMKREVERAKERATLRHKHTGKWARQMRGKEGMDDETRGDIEEMLERGEKLRRRIKGIGSDESDGENDDDEDDDDMDLDESVAKIKQRAFDELQELEEEAGEESEKRKGKSVFEMKFMKDAAARQNAEANRERDDFIRQMGGALDENDSDDQDSFKEPDSSAGVISHKVGGRIQYRPGESANAMTISRNLRSLPSDTSSVTLKSTDLLSPPPQSPIVSSSSRPLLSSTEPSTSTQSANPWLVRDTDASSKIAKKKNEVVVSKDSKSADKSKNKLKKQMQKLESAKQETADDAAVEVSLDNLLASSSAPAIKFSNSKPSSSRADTTSAAVDRDSDFDSNSELEAQEKILESKGKGKNKNPLAFQQRDLVALAFAGDNVVQNFEEAKRREIAEDAPREVDMSIPGWGSWGGAGVRKAAPKPERIKKIAGVDPKTRADYNKKNIIISEKRDKKASKYMIKDLPYPYTSKEQFERAMERPLGADWNTRVAFQRATLPRVMKKPGVIIDPLEKVL